jgi:hypothetical protein
MAYATWSDVENVFPEAGTIESVGANQTAALNAASSLVDTFLAGVMRTPIQQESDGAYPQIVIDATAYFCADRIARRRFDDPDDIEVGEYDGLVYTGTRFGHAAMSLIQALRQAKAATDEQDTTPDLTTPLVETSFSTTNGSVEARYNAGRYTRDAPAIYKFTVASTDGTVAGDDLTWTVLRDYDETVYSALAVKDSNWQAIENGLEIRFVDASSTPIWTNSETLTVTCRPYTAHAVTEGLRVVEVHRG